MNELPDWFEPIHIPVQAWINSNFLELSLLIRPYFDILRGPLALAIDTLAVFLGTVSPPLVLGAVFLAVWQMGGLINAGMVVATLVVVGALGVWVDTAQTFALILTSVAMCLAVGLPLGFLAARSNRLEATMKPVLDLMQTLPAFVYLVPIVLLVGIGSVPGVLVTFVFAVPPTIRLTSLALRSVPPQMVEAAQALGATPTQVLFKVEIPNAVDTVLLGINQTVMMALAMVTYASMIGVGGLGRLVLQGIGRLDMGLATVGGLGIVGLAILFSQLFVTKQRNHFGPAWLASPAAMARALLRATKSRFRGHEAVPAPHLSGDQNHA